MTEINLPYLFQQKEQEYGLPSGYLGRTAQIESRMDPNAQNPDSSAGGLFQFIDSTAASYGLTNKFDAVASTDAAARLARDNMATLREALGRDPTGAELYLAHQQGGGRASKLLLNPDTIVGGDEIDLNGGKSGMSSRDFANQWIAKFDGEQWDPTTYVGVNAATGPDIYQQQDAEEKGPQAYDSWWEEVGQSMKSSSWTAHMLNWMSEGTADPFYTPSQMFDADGLKQYPEFYHDYLLDATSADNAKSRIKWVDEDMVRRERLNAGGGSAIAAEVVSGILDPVPLVAGVLTLSLIHI